MYTLTIPVKPYVRKFIEARYQYKNNTWYISKEDRLGKFVYNLLDRVPKRDAARPKELGDWLNIGISYRYANFKGIYLSPESIADFNALIRLELVEEVVEYIHKLKSGVGIKKYNQLYIEQILPSGRKKTKTIIKPNMHQYIELREVIYDVFKQYNISEDDYPFENIQKDVQRIKLPLLVA